MNQSTKWGKFLLFIRGITLAAMVIGIFYLYATIRVPWIGKKFTGAQVFGILLLPILVMLYFSCYLKTKDKLDGICDAHSNMCSNIDLDDDISSKLLAKIVLSPAVPVVVMQCAGFYRSPSDELCVHVLSIIGTMIFSTAILSTIGIAITIAIKMKNQFEQERLLLKRLFMAEACLFGFILLMISCEALIVADSQISLEHPAEDSYVTR